jgi:hypothetical protein
LLVQEAQMLDRVCGKGEGWTDSSSIVRDVSEKMYCGTFFMKAPFCSEFVGAGDQAEATQAVGRVRGYYIRWLHPNGAVDPAVACVRGSELYRENQQPPLSMAQIRTWLQEQGVAECQQVDAKGMPCLWRVVPPLAQKYGLPAELPPEVVSS